MGWVTRDFLILYRLCPTYCSLNLFRILGNVDSLYRKMGDNLSHHDVNWVYSFQTSKDIGYYLKTRVLAIRLIFYLSRPTRVWMRIF